MRHLVWDCDSTLIREESFDVLAKLVLDEQGAKRFAEITELGMRGEIGFTESLRERMKTIVGLGIHQDAFRMAASQLSLSASVLKNLDWFRGDAEVDHVVVTGGFLYLLEEVLRPLELPEGSILSNQFQFNPEGYLTGYDEEHPLAKTGGKVAMVRQIAAERGWNPAEIVMIGDGSTDRQVRDQGAALNYVAYAENVQRSFFAQERFVAGSIDEVRSIVAGITSHAEKKMVVV